MSLHCLHKSFWEKLYKILGHLPYIYFQAIHFLGIPTTRAGTCITSDSTVVRDIFYDGNPIHEKCSIVSRIAQSFVR